MEKAKKQVKQRSKEGEKHRTRKKHPKLAANKTQKSLAILLFHMIRPQQRHGLLQSNVSMASLATVHPLTVTYKPSISID